MSTSRTLRGLVVLAAAGLLAACSIGLRLPPGAFRPPPRPRLAARPATAARGRW